MSKGHTAHYQTPTMKTTTQIFAAVVAGAALNVGLAATNLHPVNALIAHTHPEIEMAGPITLPEVDLTATAVTTVVDKAADTLPTLFYPAALTWGFAEGFYGE